MRGNFLYHLASVKEKLENLQKENAHLESKFKELEKLEENKIVGAEDLKRKFHNDEAKKLVDKFGKLEELVKNKIETAKDIKMTFQRFPNDHKEDKRRNKLGLS